MHYQVSKNLLTLEAQPEFNVKDICHCGQLFRFFENGTHTTIISTNQIANILPEKNGEIKIECSNERYFENYFDLDTDYEAIKQSLPTFEFMQKAIEFGKGIRILKQDFFETCISFLVSQNNMIPRIQKTLNRLSQDYGEKIDGGFSFPSREVLLEVDEKYFESIGLGYRAKYFPKFISEFDDETKSQIESLKTLDARERLLQFLGIGPKVADCILLFGLHKMNVFPVDTWIAKIAQDNLHFQEKNRNTLSKKLVEHFGDNAGYAQQYLFYYKRELTLKNKKRGEKNE